MLESKGRYGGAAGQMQARKKSNEASVKKKSKKKISDHFDVPETQVDDDVLSDEDFRFLKENAQYANALANLDVRAITKKPTKAKTLPYRKPSVPKEGVDDIDEDLDEAIQAATIVTESSDDDNDEIQQTLVEDSEGSDNESAGEVPDAISEESGSDEPDEEFGVDEIPSDLETSEGDSECEPERARRSFKNPKDEEDEEADYEVFPRRAPKQSAPSTRLPIKTQDGRLVHKTCLDDHSIESLSSDEEPEVAKRPASKRKVDVHADLDASDMHPLERIAQACQRVLECPEANVSLVSRVMDYVQKREAKPAMIKVQKMAILALCQVYLDVIPGYRIQELTAAQKAEKVSKDVSKLRKFEQGLLANYQKYLSALDKIIKRATVKPSRVTFTSTAAVAVQSYCRLIKVHPHFNFRLNVLHVIIKQLRCPTLVPLILETLKDVFIKDEDGEVSSEAVRILSKTIKAAGYAVDPDIVRIFGTLRLKHELTLEDLRAKTKEKATKIPLKHKKGQRNDKATFVNKKQRKALKRQQEAEKDLLEAEAVVSLDERKKHHRVTLEHVFLTYFRVLKYARTAPSIPAVLEGLSQFAHLISIEYFNSLFLVFRAFLDDPTVPNRSKLLIIVTANRVMSGQGQVLNNLDVADFYTCCYTVLGDLALSSAREEATLRTALEVIEAMFLRRKGASNAVIAAFFVRIAIVGSSCEAPAVALACLSLLSMLADRHGFLRSLALDSPSDRPSTGRYQPWVEDPALANAEAACPGAALSLMGQHWHPDVRKSAAAIVAEMRNAHAGQAQQGSRILSWAECLDRWDWRETARFVPNWEEEKGNKKGAGVLKARNKRKGLTEDEDSGDESVPTQNRPPKCQNANKSNGKKLQGNFKKRKVNGGRKR